MHGPAGKDDASIGALFGQLADDARAYARAEVGLYQAIARRRVGRARNGAIALVGAFLLLNAALIALLVSLALELALHTGPALAGIIMFVIVGAIAFSLVRWGARKLSALGGDPEESAALRAGESLP